jgi:hypothetical protein
MPPGVRRKRKSAQKASLAVSHERDEVPESGTPTRAIMRQAKRDLDAGRVDTDSYTRVAAASAATFRKRRRKRR